MTLLPYQSFVIRTAVSTEEVAEVLARHVEPRKTFVRHWPKDHKTFEGKVRPDGFQLQLIVDWNARLGVRCPNRCAWPVAYGQFEQVANATSIHVQIMLPPAMLIVLACLAVIPVLVALSAAVTGDWKECVETLIFAFGALDVFSMPLYWFDGWRTKEQLRAILDL